MTEGELDRILRWLRDVAAGQSASRVDVPGGMACLHPDFPVVHTHNHVLLWSPVGAATADRAAQQVLGAAGVPHRVIGVLDPALMPSLEPGLTELGYHSYRDLIMVHRADPDAGAGQRRAEVEQLDVEERSRVTADWRREEHPDWPETDVQQLGQRIRTMLPVAEVTLLGVRGRDGSVAARADLYVRDGIAQVEEVVTHEAARGRGYATALVTEAVRRARAAGADPVFLLADADDWPAALYRRLGFRDLAVIGGYVRDA